jgi:cardiolipin synthase
MAVWNDFWQIFSLMFLATAIPVALIIISEKRSPYKTIAWILVLILLPIVGVVFYLFFGQEYRKQKMFSRKGLNSLSRLRQLSSKQLREFELTQLNLDKDVLEKENIIRLLLNNSSALLTTGNKLEILNGGEKTFDSIFEAIQFAHHHIHLEYYIFADDNIGNRLKDLLIEKSEQGVEVRIIIDDVGSWGLNKRFFSNLKAGGVEIYSFMDVRFPRLTSRVNFRNHRKIAIIDGKIGFTGGINIADRYIEGVPKLGHWRDTHLRIEGDAVASLQVVFAADWYFVTNDNLKGKKYFPPFTEKKGISMQIVAGGPDYDWENISQAFFSAISNARKKIYIVTPYLMPPPPLLMALKTAALSQVDVRILIPEKSDVITPRWSTFSYVEELLEAGVKIYFYQNGFIHSKIMIVDDTFSTIGTTNFDFRSFETNFEVNAFVYNKEFTYELAGYFREDLRNSREIKLKQWIQRPWHFKLRESLAHVIAPMM